MIALETAARNLLAHWDTPAWKQTQPTADLMGDLRRAVNAMPKEPTECQTEREKIAFAFGWFKALEEVRNRPTVKDSLTADISGRIADCLLEDHVALMAENAALREALDHSGEANKMVLDDPHPPHRLCECRACMEYWTPLPACDAHSKPEPTTNLCQNSTELVETDSQRQHRYAGHFGD